MVANKEATGLSDRNAAVPVLLSSVVLLTAGNSLLSTLLGVRGTLEGMSQIGIGLVMSFYFIGFMAGAVFSPRFVSTVGYVRTHAALASTASAVALAQALLVSPVAWLFFRAIHGFCTAGMTLVIESWLAGTTSVKSRGSVLAMYGVVLMGAAAASQLLLTVASPAGSILFILVSICISLALVPLSLAPVAGGETVEMTRISLKRMMHLAPLAVTGVFVGGLSMNALLGMGSVFGKAMGLTTSQIALFVMAPSLGALLLQWPLGILSDRIDRRKVLLGSSILVLGLSVVLVASRLLPFGTLVILTSVLGGIGLSQYSVGIAHANDLVAAKERVGAARLLVLIYGAGAVLGPFCSGLVMHVIGPLGLFISILIIYAFFLLFAYPRYAHREEVAMHRKRRFMAYPGVVQFTSRYWTRMKGVSEARTNSVSGEREEER